MATIDKLLNILYHCANQKKEKNMKNYLREIKRIICLFCTICLIVCITACNGTDQNGDNNGGLENKNPNWNSDDLEYNINIPNKIALYSAESVYQIIIETDFRYNTNDDAEFKTKQSKSRGSAFAINKEGYLMTCAHVICIDKEEYKTVEYVSRTVTAISFLSKYTFECDVIAYDEGYDLAVLKIKTDAINEDAKQYLQNNYLPFFKYKGSDSFSNYSNNNLWFGEYCMAIGYPKGKFFLTQGIITNSHIRWTTDGSYTGEITITHSAITNPGNSGGALVNAYCAIIGITSASHKEATGIGYAITTYLAMTFLDSLSDGTYRAQTKKFGTNGTEIDFNKKEQVAYYHVNERAFYKDKRNYIKEV